MKNCSIFLLPVSLIFFLSGNYQQKKNQNLLSDGTGKWTGTISMEENFTGVSGTSRRHVTVSFVDALPTLHREDETTYLEFTDDKGTGSASYHAEGFVGGKKWATTDCQGSGKSELHEVVVDEADNTYSIHAIGPGCSGQTVSHVGEPTTPYGPDYTDITISDERLVNKNVLAGTKSTTADVVGMGTVTTTITWSLSRSTNNNVELIVTPEDYDNWLPEPGQNELTKGTAIKINLKIYGRNGQPPASKARSFELTLSNTSKEPGITINAPLVPLTRLPDLRFLPQANAGIGQEFQLAKVKCMDGVSGDISIGAFDGGAYATLTAVAILEDNSRIEGHLLISGGHTEIQIPKRTPGTKIGEAWLIVNNNPGETDDKENSTGNSNDGDGLTAYEEYRGVISEGEFLRLDPNKKELGVKMKRTEISLFSEGISKFENATGLKVIRFGENEIGQDRRFNKNFLTAHIYDQYALFLQKGTLTGDLGKSFGSPAIPMQVSKTVIDQNRIRLSYQDRLAEANSINMTLSYTEKDLFATVTAHEMAHSVNVPHHGSMAPTNIDVMVEADRTQVRIFAYNRMEIPKRYHVKGRGGEAGNEQSGDVNCFMLNNALCDWVVKQTTDSVFFYQVPLIPLGTKLCTDKGGTGLNALKDANGNYIYFGDAANGNCLDQIKLK